MPRRQRLIDLDAYSQAFEGSVWTVVGGRLVGFEDSWHADGDGPEIVDRLRLDYAEDDRVVSVLIAREELSVSELRGRVAMLVGRAPQPVDETALPTVARPDVEVDGVVRSGRAFAVDGHELVALAVRPWCYLLTTDSFHDRYPALVAGHGSVSVLGPALNRGDDGPS